MINKIDPKFIIKGTSQWKNLISLITDNWNPFQSHEDSKETGFKAKTIKVQKNERMIKTKNYWIKYTLEKSQLRSVLI